MSSNQTIAGGTFAQAATLNERDRLEAVSRIVAAFASRESAVVEDVLELTERVSLVLFSSTALPDVQHFAPKAEATVSQSIKPALKIEDAITRDKVYCLCCGKGFTMLKRHLKAEHGLTEDQYRAQFGLPEDFPLVAPSYSERKAAYAREAGLGKYAREGGPSDVRTVS